MKTTDRAGMDYHYSTSYPFHFSDTTGALIFPPSSQTEGWYYFSVLGLLLIILFIVVSLKDDKGLGLKRRFVALMIIWWGVISYISYGADSYLFDFLWRFLPGFSQLRAWGRVNIVLLPLIALLLARSYDHFEELLGLSEEVDKGRGKTGWALAILAVSAAIVLAGQWWLYVHKSFNFYWLYFFSNFHGWEAVFIFVTIGSFILLAGLLVLSIWWPLASSKSLAAVALLCVAIAAIDMRQVGSEQWSYPASHDQAVRRRLDISNAMIGSLTTPRDNVRETISLIKVLTQGTYGTGTSSVIPHSTAVCSPLTGPTGLWTRKKLPGWLGYSGLYDGTRLFVSTRIDHSSVRDFFEDSDKTVYEVQPQVIVEAYDGDRLVLDVSTGGPMFLNFIDNWDADWVARSMADLPRSRSSSEPSSRFGWKPEKARSNFCTVRFLLKSLDGAHREGCKSMSCWETDRGGPLEKVSPARLQMLPGIGISYLILSIPPQSTRLTLRFSPGSLWKKIIRENPSPLACPQRFASVSSPRLSGFPDPL